MKENDMKKVQSVISSETYGTLLFLKAKERSTMSKIVEKAITEYAENHYPEAIDLARGE